MPPIFSKNSSISADFDREGDTLLVSFGGVAQGIIVPKFEFKRSASGLSAKLLFIRDLSQSWYHSSMPGIGVGMKDIANKIKA